MIMLGISYLSDAGACVLKNGAVKSVINEERLNRVKLFYGIPEMSIKWVLEDAGLSMKDVDVIVTHGYCGNERGIEFINHGLDSQIKERESAFERVTNKILVSGLSLKDKKRKFEELRLRYEHENNVIFNRNVNTIRRLKKFGKPIKVVEHHISHAACAYFTSGWNECYVLTVDGWGEAESSIFCRARDGKLEKLFYSHSFDSLGYFYGSITKALGFTPHRHEGKVLGLAASGNPKEVLPWMRKMICYNRKKKRFEGGFENGIYNAKFDNPALCELVKKHKREDVAAAAQLVLENAVCDFIKDILPKGKRLAVAGGIFANVRLNQKIAELPGVKDLYVYPQMGDGGLAAGSALYYYSTKKRLKPVFLKSLYKGPKFTNNDLEEAIKAFGYTYRYYRNIESKIADLLVKSNVVMRFAGRMEYGPRALGNRSILFNSSDRSVNTWLNTALRRSEFMPFAPATIKEKADKCYKYMQNRWKRALYMTETFDCTSWMKKKSPGVVHVDGTARPQIVTKKSNPSFYKVIKYYYKMTKIPNIINTSFNMHEEPIVCTPRDALRAFHDSKLKYLAMGNYMVAIGENDLLFNSERGAK